MNWMVLGGTKGMGRAIVRAAAARGDRVFLLARDLEDGARSLADLEARSPGSGAGVAHCDLADPSGFAAALDAGWAALGRVDAFVITAARFGTQDALEADVALAQQLLTINFANTVTLCEHARPRLLDQGGGTLCVFSSVAGDRGRKPVGLYGSTKAGLSHYLESLDHKYHAAGLKTICVKPGFVKTGMTAGLDPPPFAGEPEQVARDVLRAVDRGTALVYTPAIWRYVMLVIRHLPRFVMRRIGF